MKLYVALLDQLTPGQRLAQNAHVVGEMWAEWPEATRAWRASSNVVAVVTVDRYDLAELAADPRAVEFREPDMGDARTAVALWPSTAASERILQRAPLAD